MQQRRPGFPARIAPSVPGGQRPAAVPAVQRPVSIPAPAGLGLDSAAVRARMVQRLAAGGVSSGAVLTAMGAVERHRFVDSGAGYGRSHCNQTLTVFTFNGWRREPFNYIS